MGKNKIYIIFDLHGGSYDKLRVVDSQVLRNQQGFSTFIPSDYSQASSVLFYGDGSVLHGISPSNNGNRLGFQSSIFDLKSKYTQLSCVKTRYSKSKESTMVYLGISNGEVYVVNHKTRERIQKFSVFVESSMPVTAIGFVPP